MCHFLHCVAVHFKFLVRRSFRLPAGGGGVGIFKTHSGEPAAMALAQPGTHKPNSNIIPESTFMQSREKREERGGEWGGEERGEVHLGLYLAKSSRA